LSHPGILCRSCWWYFFLLTFLKILGKVIQTILLDHLHKNNILSIEQYEFRRGFTTENAVYKQIVGGIFMTSHHLTWKFGIIGKGSLGTSWSKAHPIPSNDEPTAARFKPLRTDVLMMLTAVQKESIISVPRHKVQLVQLLQRHLKWKIGFLSWIDINSFKSHFLYICILNILLQLNELWPLVTDSN